MAIVTTVTNQKGGVGKTTTAHALATGLTHRGYKTLLIDIDPQGNLSFTMGADAETIGIYEALQDEASIDEIIQHTKQGDIITSNLLLAGADMEFTQTGREFLLRDIINTLKNDYDYIIIDTPPTLGILTINALTASNNIIIPMCADIYSLQGLGQLYNTISKVKQYCNPSLTIAGLLITRYSGRAILSQDIKETIQAKAEQLQTNLYDTFIREGIAIKEAQTQQESIYIHAPKSNVAIDYLSFVDEYISQNKTEDIK